MNYPQASQYFSLITDYITDVQIIDFHVNSFHFNQNSVFQQKYILLIHGCIHSSLVLSCLAVIIYNLFISEEEIEGGVSGRERKQGHLGGMESGEAMVGVYCTKG